ncbi:MAG: SDR family NAD(P)-dependent oxidoreductase [Alkalispirochaetaceae bacterium]
MNCYIVTGTSRGLGAAIARGLVERGGRVVGLSRTEGPDLAAEAAQNNGRYVHLLADLSDSHAVPGLLTEALGYLDLDKAREVTLINNAGLLEPIAPVDEADPEAVERHITVNLTSPILLTGAFIAGTSRLRCLRQVVNITSGAASKPYPGWSSYCAGKAGLDMLTRVVAEENASDERFRTIAVAPGVVETAMQARIRSTEESSFPLREKFVRLKEEGKLSSPESAARKVIAAMEDYQIESGSLIDVRERYPE